MEIARRKPITLTLKIILDTIWYLSLAGLALVVLMAVRSVFLGDYQTTTMPVVFELEEANYTIKSEAFGIETAALGQATAELTFDTLGTKLFQVNLFIAALGLLLTIWILFNLRCVFATGLSGTPLVLSNVGRIRWNGLAIIAGELSQSLGIFLEQYFVMKTFTSSGIHFGASVDIQVASLIAGFAVIILSEVFRAGASVAEV